MIRFTSGKLEAETVSTATCYNFTTIGCQEELTDEEVLELAERAGTFNFLDAVEEDIYTVGDGDEIKEEMNIISNYMEKVKLYYQTRKRKFKI